VAEWLDMIWLPGNGSRGGEAPIIRCLVWRYNLQPLTLTLSTEMVRLAEDGAMLKIARFGKQFRSLRGRSRIFRIVSRSGEIDNPNSKAQLTGRSGQLIFRADSLLL
jgi:hypothetical protein